MTYSDEDIDDALERIAADVLRRAGQADFPEPAVTALLAHLRRMEGARRAGDAAGAQRAAGDALAGLEKYRPTNATSRSKAVLGEVVASVLAGSERP
jgi:hypothetical protein